MRLYVVRHGIAIDRDDPACPAEEERYLTGNGIRETRKAARGLKAMGIEAGLMVSSPLVRAVQTAEIFAEELGSKKRLKKTAALEPEATPEKIFVELAKLKASAQGIMIFGHAPHLDRAIALAVGARQAATALRKSGVACLELESLAPPRGTLTWLLTPKLLRALAKKSRQ